MKSSKSVGDITYKDFIDKNRAQKVITKGKNNLHGIYQWFVKNKNKLV